MTREEARTLAEQNNMEIMRHHITHEAQGVFVVSDTRIPDLDAWADRDPFDPSELPCAVVRENVAGEGYEYKIYCPSAWFDLWGWRDA